nr:glycosyltransferase [Bacteriovoracaceae bacterium]
MKIVFEHAGILPVQAYGGIERMLFWHMKELVRLGHEVILIGHPKSQVSEYGIKLIPNQLKDFRPLIPKSADILHLFYPSHLNFPLPVIFNIGGNGRVEEVFHPNSVFVSRKHAENHNSEVFVYNALDFKEYPFHKKVLDWKNFLFLAKASWKVKNLKDCKKVCRKNKKHLHIAGGRTFPLSAFWHSYGMVPQNQKISLLKKCDALLFPVRWEEPFGLAIIEAMALGLPVIGSCYGSLPEIITPEAGFLCKDFTEFFQVVKEKPYSFQSSVI